MPHLTDAAFFAHWRHPHGTLTRRIPQFRRYVQNHGVAPSPAVPGLAAGPWLGMPAIWLDGPGDLAKARSHPAYALLDADADAFYDRTALDWLVGRETIYIPHAGGANSAPVKVMLLLRRSRAPLTPRRVRVLADSMASLLPGLTGISITLPVDTKAAAPCDAVMELSFPDLAAYSAAWGNGARICPVIADVADLAASKGLLVREERVIWPDGEREGISHECTST
ncbi:MAG TPA: EthD domain-containing protein [Sphingobium sp.]